MDQHTTTPGPTIARPNVLVVNAPGGRREARCTHCPWTYANTAKTDVEYMARYHRGQHRRGGIEVTP